MVDVEKIKQLREETGLSLGECKKALETAGGKIEKARSILKKAQKKLASKRKGRAVEQGLIASYIHSNRKVGVLLDLRSETDFVARSKRFYKLAHFLTMQIAAMNPKFIKKEDIPADFLREKREVWKAEFKGQGKPDEVIDDIVEGKMKKLEKEISLFSQPFIKDEDKTVKDVVDSFTAEFGENIVVKRFTRYEI